MRRLMLHLLNETRLILHLKRRYWFETILGLCFLLILFGGLVYAVLTVGGLSFDSGAMDGMIVGFALWQFAAASYGSASSDVAEETRQRTIEQLYVGPMPFAWLLGIRVLLHLLGGLFVLLIALALIDGLTAGRLNLDLLPILPAVILGAPALVGVGFAMAGLLLLMKKAEIAHGLMYIALISVVALPAYPVNAFALLPYALGAAVAKAAASGAAIPWSVYGLIALSSAVYLALGLLFFQAMERRARKLGVLGHW